MAIRITATPRCTCGVGDMREHFYDCPCPDNATPLTVEEMSALREILADVAHRPELEGSVCNCGCGYGMHTQGGLRRCRLCGECPGFIKARKGE